MAKDTIIAIGAGGQVTGDAIPTVNTKAPISAVNFGGLVIWPPTLMALVVEPSILVVCLKHFTYHIKHLKVFHVWKYIISKQMKHKFLCSGYGGAQLVSLTMVVVGRERRKKKWERERNTRVREREGKFGKKYSQYN